MTDALVEKIDATPLSGEARVVADELARALGHSETPAPEAIQTGAFLKALLDLPWAASNPAPLGDPEQLAAAIDIGQYAPAFYRRMLIDYLLSSHLDAESAPGAVILSGPPGSGRRHLIRRAADELGLSLAIVDLSRTANDSDIFGHSSDQGRGQIGALTRALTKLDNRRGVVVLANINWALTHWPDHGANLLNLLTDPNSRTHWRDRFLDVEFDLTDTRFAITVDGMSGLAPEYAERMPVIDCPGYTRDARAEIVAGALWGQVKERFAIDGPASFDADAAQALVTEYTPEPGFAHTRIALTELARHLAAMPDGAATQSVDAPKLREILGRPRAYFRAEREFTQPGMVRSLPLNPDGAAQLIEAVPVPGGRYYSTPDGTSPAMSKVCDTAYYYVRSRMTELDISARQLYEYGYKLNHNLVGVDADVESLTLAVLVALVSSLRDRPVHPETAVVGEMNQNGHLMGGIGLAHRLLSAQRAGIRRIILPRSNAPDVEDLPAGLEQDMTLIMVSDADQAIRVALS